MRNLMGRPPMKDAFGKSGRVWLSGVDLPRDERQTVDGCLRQIDFLNEEVAILEREIALHALDSAEIEVFEAWFGDLFDELFSTRH